MQKIGTMKKYNNIEEAIAYVRTLPLETVINIAAESLIEPEIKQIPRITITEEQFQSYFKIRGVNELGERETRGRKRKEV